MSCVNPVDALDLVAVCTGCVIAIIWAWKCL